MKDNSEALVSSRAMPAPATSPPEKPVKLADAFNPRVNLRGLWQRPEGALSCLDGLRAFAVIWVVIYHCFTVWGGMGGPPSGPGPWNDIYSSFPMQLVLSGDLGVDVFFALSGFLIALQAVRELRRNGCINFSAFVWARWWRIAPTYYVALLFLAVTNITGYSSSCAQNWWLNVLFLNNLQNHGFGGILDRTPDCAIWTWSIAVEFQFYMLTPFVLWLCCRNDGKLRPHCFKTLLGLFLGFQFICAGLYFGFRTDIEEPAVMNNMLWTRAQSYIVGIAACLAYSGTELQGKQTRGLRVVDGLAGLLFVTVACLGNGRNPDQPIAYWSPIARVVCLLLSQGLLAASVSWAAFRMCSGCMPWLDSLLSRSVWVPFARLSYSAYLLQFVAITPLRANWQVFPEDIGRTEAFVRFVVFCIASLAMVFAVALVHYLLVEGPSLRLRKRATPQCLART